MITWPLGKGGRGARRKDLLDRRSARNLLLPFNLSQKKEKYLEAVKPPDRPFPKENEKGEKRHLFRRHPEGSSSISAYRKKSKNRRLKSTREKKEERDAEAGGLSPIFPKKRGNQAAHATL